MAWGLEQTRYFTQGCDNLVIVTDHKPLVKIFGDRTLDEITNSRLFRLKQHTLSWRFEIRHLSGKSNHAADATSRHPSQSCSQNVVSLGSPSLSDIAALALMITTRNNTQELGASSWSLLAQETTAHASLSHLLQLIEQGKQIARDDPTLTSLRPICESRYSERAYSYTRTVSWFPHPYATEFYRIYMQLIKEPPQWNSVPAPSSTGWGCRRTSAKLGRDAQTATETHLHRPPHPLFYLHDHHPHLKPSS